MQDEIRLRCLGKATPASRLVPLAVQAVGQLRAVDQFGFKQIYGPNWSIEIKLTNGLAVVTIWTDEEGGETSCPPYMSGLTQYGVSISKTDPATGAKSEALWGFQPSSAYAAENKLSPGWQTGSYGRSPAPGFAGSPPYDPSLGTHIPGGWRADDWSQAALLKPGLYSGTMRNVVQVLLGSEAQVPYDFHFGRTHGVYVQGAGASRVDWLIEISADNGVMAMPMPSCDLSVPETSTLGYVPTGETFPTGDKLAKAIRSGAVRQLATPDVLAAVYAKSPFSTLFGWAFDYTGRRASVVVYTVAQYYTTYLYTLTISGDDSGPTSAALTLDTSGTVVSPGYSSSTGYCSWAFKVPQALGGSSYPIDFAPTFGTYAPADVTAPLHVWYSKSGSRSVVWFRNGVISTGRPSDENRRPRPPGNGPFDPAPVQHWGKEPGNLGVTWVEYDESLTGPYSSQHAPAAYVNSAPPLSVSAQTRYTFLGLATGTQKEAFLRGYTECTVTERGVLREYRSTQNNFTLTVNSAVIIPSFEREAALQNLVVTQGSDSETKSFNSYDAGAVSCVYFNHDFDAKLPIRSDGMPLSGTFSAVGATGWSGQISVGSSPITNGYSALANFPIWGSFGGFSGGFSASGLPGSFSPPGGFALGSPSNPYGSLEPFSDGRAVYKKYSRSMVKTLFCEGGEIRLANLPGDEISEASIVPSLGDWFYFTGSFYPLIQSHDGALRYSPPGLSGGDQDDLSKSALGAYQPPSVGAELLLNFVGDA